MANVDTCSGSNRNDGNDYRLASKHVVQFPTNCNQCRRFGTFNGKCNDSTVPRESAAIANEFP